MSPEVKLEHKSNVTLFQPISIKKRNFAKQEKSKTKTDSLSTPSQDLAK